MDTTLPTLLIRNDTKQAFTQARRLAMKDSVERLQVWVEELNTELGWKKYGVMA